MSESRTNKRGARKRSSAARPGSKRLQMGRMPQQARSRERVDVILEVSRALILREGATGLKMSTIAERARVPIASVYQYFPTRNAIIAHLYQEYLSQGRVIAHECLDGAQTRAAYIAALRRFVRRMHEFNRSGGTMREVFRAVVAEPAIRGIYQKEHDFYCQTIFETAQRAGVSVPADLLRVRSTLAYRLWLSAMEVAIEQDEATANEYVEEALVFGLQMVGMNDS